MSFEDRLAEAVRSVIPDAEPNVYEGDSRVFATWNFNESPRLFADGKPRIRLNLVQVHVHMPRKWPWAEIKGDMEAALFRLGGTWPWIVDASDRDGEHLVFEFEIAEGMNG